VRDRVRDGEVWLASGQWAGADPMAWDEESRTAACLPGHAWAGTDIDRITSPGDAPASPSPET